MVKRKKWRVIFSIVSVEWIFFGCWYLMSSDGLKAIMRIKHECVTLEQQIAQATIDVDALKRECAEWQTNTFYVERYARNRLSMSYPGDEVVITRYSETQQI